MSGASDGSLRSSAEQHRQETRAQSGRLEQVAQACGIGGLTGKTCQAAKGLVAEGQEMLDEDGDLALKDAGIIVGLQRVEHHGIAGYGTALAYAKRLGYDEAARLLAQTLEEKATDAKLSELAETKTPRQR